MHIDIPALTTDRLILRGFRESDLDAFAAMNADPEVVRYLGVGPNAGKPRTREETWTTMAIFMGQWALKGYGTFAVEERAPGSAPGRARGESAGGRFIGRVGIIHQAGWPEPELAYALTRDAWGRGFATEACRAVLAWGFPVVGAERFVSYVRPANEGSARVLARLGATELGMGELMGVACMIWAHHPVPTAVA